jgi:hypothetical protein
VRSAVLQLQGHKLIPQGLFVRRVHWI